MSFLIRLVVSIVGLIALYGLFTGQDIALLLLMTWDGTLQYLKSAIDQLG